MSIAMHTPAEVADRAHGATSMVQAIERGLDALDEAAARGDAQAVADRAQALHGVLAQAVQGLRAGHSLPPELILRLTWAQARARAHQSAVSRGRVAAERALSVLLVREDADATYQSQVAPAGSMIGRMAAAYR